MMGKKQEQADLVGDLEQEIEDLRDALGEANQRADRLARDNDAHRARESARMRLEHDEQQRERKRAERAAALERIEAIRKNLLPLDGAEQVAVTRKGDDTRISVTVKLTDAEARAVHEHYLTHSSEDVQVVDGHSIKDAINRMKEEADWIARTGTYPVRHKNAPCFTKPTC